MITVKIPLNTDFNFKECEYMFEKYREEIGDTQPFSEIVNNTFFYSFYHNSELIGCIYYFIKNNKMYLNAFAGRGHHLLNLECLKNSLDWFDCDIYSKTKRKPAALCLLRCGFKKVGTNLYVYRR